MRTMAHVKGFQTFVDRIGLNYWPVTVSDVNKSPGPIALADISALRIREPVRWHVLPAHRVFSVSISGIGREHELHEFNGLRAGIDTGPLRVTPPPDHPCGVAGDTARAVGVIWLHHDRRHAGDRPVLDLILEELGDLALVVQAALLEPEPGDVDQAAGVGRLPTADRSDERGLNVLGVRAHRLGQHVGRQYLALLLQVRVLLLRRVVAGLVTSARFHRGTADRPGAAGRYGQRGGQYRHAHQDPTTHGGAHLPFAIV